jgi:hypothetical protein
MTGTKYGTHVRFDYEPALEFIWSLTRQICLD